jgi:hypothetical protein
MPDLVPELGEYRRQFEAIRRDAELLLGELTQSQLLWRARADSWSIADCLNHLVVTGEQSVANIRRAVGDARARGPSAGGSCRHGRIGNWLVRLMDAPATIRFKAPKAYRPMTNVTPPEIVVRFFLLQDELLHAIEEANGVDLTAVKVSNPVSRWFRLSLGQELAFTAAHERRHLAQASRVRDGMAS